MKKILISAGEASGDLHASSLVKEVLQSIQQQAGSSIEFYGMGGTLMQKAGVHIVADIKDLAIIGGLEVLANFHKVLRMMRTMRRALLEIKPDLVILVDYPGFNLWLAKIAKKYKIKVLYYISPKIWAWRSGRIKKIRARVDHMAVIFPFEVDIYKKAEIPVTFVGHPLLKIAHPRMSVNVAKQRFSVDFTRKTVGLFPGSRKGEIKHLFPDILRAARLLQQKLQGEVQFILPQALSISDADLAPYLKGSDLPIGIVKDNVYDVIQVCDAVITVSGTVTLELALFAVPMVIIYRMARVNYHLLKRMIKVKYIGLPNIVAEKKIIQELIQDDASAENIFAEIFKILQEQNYRTEMINNLVSIRDKLQAQKEANAAGNTLSSVIFKMLE